MGVQVGRRHFNHELVELARVSAQNEQIGPTRQHYQENQHDRN